MPNWIDEEGYDWYGKIECKRCFRRFKYVVVNRSEEVPLHACHDGWFTSEHDGVFHNAPKFVRRYTHKELLELARNGYLESEEAEGA